MSYIQWNTIQLIDELGKSKHQLIDKMFFRNSMEHRWIYSSFMWPLVIIFMMDYCNHCISNGILSTFKYKLLCRTLYGVLSKSRQICCWILGSNLFVKCLELTKDDYGDDKDYFEDWKVSKHSWSGKRTPYLDYFVQEG